MNLRTINIVLLFLMASTVIITVYATTYTQSLYETITISISSMVESMPLFETITISISNMTSSIPLFQVITISISDMTQSSQTCLYQTITISLTIRGNTPVIQSVMVNNLDDGDNLYAKYKTYTISSVVNDVNGYSDIDTVTFTFFNGLNNRAIFTYTEDDDTFVLTSGGTYLEYISSGTHSDKSVDTLELTINFKLRWGAVTEGLTLTAFASDGNTDTTLTSQYPINAVTLLLIDDLNVNNIANVTTYSGTLVYSNNGIPSTLYPSDSEFTYISMHNSVHTVLATDNSITNGTFSLPVDDETVNGVYIYHPYLNMTDSDYADDDMLYNFVSIIKLGSGGVIANVTLNISGDATIELDGNPITTPDTVTLTGNGTYNITAFDIPSLGVTLNVTGSANIELDGVPVVTPDSYLLSDGSTYVLDANDIPSLGVTLDVTGNANINLDGVPVVTPDSFALIDGNTYALDALNIGGGGGSFGTQAMFFFGMIALILFLITRRIK